MPGISGILKLLCQSGAGEPCGLVLKTLLLCIFMTGCGRDSAERPEGKSIAGAERSGRQQPSAPSPATVIDIPVPQPLFENSAAALGIDFTFYCDRVPGRFFLPEVMGGGVGSCDIDEDGWIDLYFVNGTVLDPREEARIEHRNKLYRSLRGLKYQDVSLVSAADDGRYGQGCAFADFNADGFSDLYLTSYGPNVLLLNNGDGTFSDITQEAGVGDARWGTSCVWLDVNVDGHSDLYVANYMDVTLENNQICQYGETVGYCGPGHYAPVPDLVYISGGDGTFREAAAEFGFNASTGKGLAVAVSDFDHDLRADIYVGNDMDANFLFTRTARPDADAGANEIRYHDVAASGGCAVSREGMNEASMGIACADFDQDGLVDLYLTHYYQMKNTLYRNLGGLLFEDDSLRTNVAATSFAFLGFGTVPLDYNGDRYPDLFVTNGHVLGPAYHPNAMTPQLLLNDGNGGFLDVSKVAGPYLEDAWLGRGLVAADVDNDGDFDIGVSHLDRPVALLINRTVKEGTFIGFELSDSDRQLPLCARVTVIDDRGEATQVVGVGGSYLSSGDDRLLFSVSSLSGKVAVNLDWPSGRTDRFDDLAVGSYWRLTEERTPEVVVP